MQAIADQLAEGLSVNLGCQVSEVRAKQLRVGTLMAMSAFGWISMDWHGLALKIIFTGPSVRDFPIATEVT